MNTRNLSLIEAFILCSSLALCGMNLSDAAAHENRQTASGRDAGRDARVTRQSDTKPQTRVYDRAHKDYHDWNDNEDRSYRQYLGERNQNYRDYSKMSRRQQTQYWNWRHTHEAEEHGTMR